MNRTNLLGTRSQIKGYRLLESSPKRKRIGSALSLALQRGLSLSIERYEQQA
jgi:hypothetical protein